MAMMKSRFPARTMVGAGWLKTLMVVGLSSFVCGELNVSGVKCGSNLVCQQYQYCSTFHNVCENCSIICEQGHNFDEHLCNQLCNDYLHGTRFVTREDYEATVKQLQHQTNVSLILNCITLAGLVLLVGFIGLKWICKEKIHQWLKKHKKKLNEKKDNHTLTEVKTIPTKTISELRLEMPPSPLSHRNGNDVDGSPATISTGITTRRGAPSEDRALDYVYDNPAMTTNST